MNYKENLSPNFSMRNVKIEYIIIHYTGMNKLNETLQLFTQPNSKVSCHWLISRRGSLYKIVDEKYMAWHAGISSWKGKQNLNNNSIGIELENKGHGINYERFTKSQIKKLEELIELLLRKYKLKTKNVLAHSDIAPNRKFDPGEKFSWESLAKKNLAYWPKLKKIEDNEIRFQLGQKNKEIFKIKNRLRKIGYQCSKNENFDISLKLVIEAFQRRFLPEQINGILDRKVCERILQVSKNA